MRSAKAQVSLRICAVWSGLRCSQTESMGNIKYFNREQLPGWGFPNVKDDMNPHILRMLESTLSLDVAHLSCDMTN